VTLCEFYVYYILVHDFIYVEIKGSNINLKDFSIDCKIDEKEVALKMPIKKC
jgi:hypothetical protein